MLLGDNNVVCIIGIYCCCYCCNFIKYVGILQLGFFWHWQPKHFCVLGTVKLQNPEHWSTQNNYWKMLTILNKNNLFKSLNRFLKIECTFYWGFTVVCMDIRDFLEQSIIFMNSQQCVMYVFSILINNQISKSAKFWEYLEIKLSK